VQTRLLANLVRELTEETSPKRELVVFDTTLARFALRVRPRSAPDKPWPSMYFVRYVGPDGRERKMKIGSPATMPLDEARKAARAVLAIVDQGGDPAAEKAAAREQWSIGQAAEVYLASSDHRRKTAKVQKGEIAALRLHVAYRLEHTPLARLDVPRVRRLIRDIEIDTRTNARGRRLGGPGAARKTIRILSAMLSWCVNEGRLDRNPLIGALRLDGDGERETVLTESAQYAALFRATDELVTAGELREASRAFLTVAALTGMRRSELQGLHWRDVNLADRRITLPTSKGARLARRGPKTEVISLPPYAAAALASIRPESASDDDRVFIPRRGQAYEINRDWITVRAKAGLPANLTLHGLRHSAGTVAVMAGLSGPEVQKLLRHRNISTTAKYIHLADRARLQDRAMAGVVPPLPEDKRTGT
jgi:integrase